MGLKDWTTQPSGSGWKGADGRDYYTYCKPCNAAVVRESNRRERAAVLAHYGTSCACCGESREEFLAIDHIDGRSYAKKDRGNGTTGAAFYRRLRIADYPKGLRTLCHNCNLARGFYGYCPHERERLKVVV